MPIVYHTPTHPKDLDYLRGLIGGQKWLVFRDSHSYTVEGEVFYCCPGSFLRKPGLSVCAHRMIVAIKTLTVVEAGLAPFLEEPIRNTEFYYAYSLLSIPMPEKLREGLFQEFIIP